MRLLNYPVLSGPDTSTQTGGKIDSNQMVSCSVQYFFGDAAAIGTIKLQGSNDPCAFSNLAQDFVPVNWNDIPNSGTQVGSVAVTAGAGGFLFLPVISYRWLRVVFVYTSGGTTAVTANICALGV